MAGTSNYPSSLDNFAAASPTNLGDNDTTGRNHAERHDDLEAAVEAIQGELGVNPAGTAATVVARLDAMPTTADLSTLVSKSVVTAKGDLIVASGSGVPDNLAVGADGTVLTADSGETLGIKWAAVGGGKDDADNIIAVQVFG